MGAPLIKTAQISRQNVHMVRSGLAVLALPVLRVRSAFFAIVTRGRQQTEEQAKSTSPQQM